MLRSEQRILSTIGNNGTNKALLEDFTEYLRRVKNGKQTQRLSSNHISKVLTIIALFLKEVIVRPHELTVYHIEDFLEKRNSRVVYLGHLRHLIRYYKDKGLISKELEKELLEIKTKNERVINLNPEDKKKFAIPKEQWQDVYKQLKTNSLRIAAFLGFSFGLRVGEILNLTIDDIDFNHKLLYITPENKPIAWHPKTFKSIRKIPMTEKEMKTLKEYILKRKSFSPYLLYSNNQNSKTNRPLSYNWLSKALNKVKINLKDLGEKTLRCHILRYSFSTHAYYNTTAKDPLMIVSNLLGHEKIEVTYKYLNLSESEMQSKIFEGKEKAGL